VKTFFKELGNDDHHWMDRAVNFILKIIRQNHNEGIYSFRSPTKVVLTLIELLIDSLTVSPFFAAKKIYKELDINNVCVLIYIFRSTKSQH